VRPGRPRSTDLAEGVERADTDPGRRVLGRLEEGRHGLERTDLAERDQRRGLLRRFGALQEFEERLHARSVPMAADHGRGGNPHRARGVLEERPQSREAGRPVRAAEPQYCLATDPLMPVGQQALEPIEGGYGPDPTERRGDRPSDLGDGVVLNRAEGGDGRVGRQ